MLEFDATRFVQRLHCDPSPVLSGSRLTQARQKHLRRVASGNVYGPAIHNSVLALKVVFSIYAGAHLSNGLSPYYYMVPRRRGARLDFHWHGGYLSP